MERQAPRSPFSRLRFRAAIRAGVQAAAVVGLATGAGFLLRDFVPVGSLSLPFVCAVLVVALRWGMGLAMFAALLSGISYNFFFTEPRFTLRMYEASDGIAVGTFCLAALVVGELVSRQREQVVELRLTAARLEEARTAGDTERLRTALLSSISHDLRTPLSAVIGAASTLAAYGESMTVVDRGALVMSIRKESERLDRYIQNLLDMTRLGAGPLQLERDWVGVEEIVAAARERVRKMAPKQRIECEFETDLPALYIHPALIEQALFNVLENAIRFSPVDAPVRVRVRRANERMLLEVVDRGPGISRENRERIFERFYSAAAERSVSDRDAETSTEASAAPGSGLGLTIVRGMIGAHGGAVEALPGEGGVGTTIRISLPIIEPPVDPEDEESTS